MGSTSTRRLDAVVVKLWRLLLHPGDKGSHVFMRLQCGPSAVASRQFFLGERRVNFSMADAVNRMLLPPALAFGQQVVFINTLTFNQRSAAQRATAQERGRMP